MLLKMIKNFIAWEFKVLPDYMNFKEMSFWLNLHSCERPAPAKGGAGFRRNDRTLDCVVYWATAIIHPVVFF